MQFAAGDPIYADDLNELLKYSVNRRHCTLVQQSGQSVSDNTETSITFGSGSESFDDYGWHSTSSNTDRITPNVAGRYRVVAQLVFAFSTTITRCAVSVSKNGSIIDSSGNHKPNSTNSVATMGGIVETFVDLNGTTDYISMSARHQSSGSASQTTNVSTSGMTKLHVELIHEP